MNEAQNREDRVNGCILVFVIAFTFAIGYLVGKQVGEAEGYSRAAHSIEERLHPTRYNPFKLL